MFEEGYAVVERSAELIQGLELLFSVPNIIEIVASQNGANGKANQSIGVAHAEPLSRRLGKCGNVTSEQEAITALACFVCCDEKEATKLASHIRTAR